MFKPGHLSLVLPSFPNQAQGIIDIHYEVRNDPTEGPMLHVRMVGKLDTKQFEAEFELHRDMACNFATAINRIAARHGVTVNQGLIMHGHVEYDQMFEDIRAKLGLQPGDPVNLDHLKTDLF